MLLLRSYTIGFCEIELLCACFPEFGAHSGHRQIFALRKPAGAFGAFASVAPPPKPLHGPFPPRLAGSGLRKPGCEAGHAFAGHCCPVRPKDRSPGLTIRLLKWAKIVSVTHITAAYGIGVEVVTVIAASFLRRPIDGLSHADSAAAAADLLQHIAKFARHKKDPGQFCAGVLCIVCLECLSRAEGNRRV